MCTQPDPGQTDEERTTADEPSPDDGASSASSPQDAAADRSDHADESEAPADESPPDTAAPHRPRIKIGSERDDYVPPATQLPPPNEPLDAPPVSEAERQVDEATHPDSPPAEEPPSEPPQTFPPPRVERTTPDLEEEIEAALGEVSLDEMVADEAARTAGDEVPLESRRQGTVVKVHREDVFFTLGVRHEGVASLKQFAEPPEPGTSIDVIVTGFDAEQGLYELTIPGVSATVGDWSDLAEGVMVEARITAHNKGGLECVINNIRGFIPASQIAIYRVENLAEFVDQKLLCVVTEADPVRRNLVLSHRAVLERERAEAKQKLMAELAAGQTCEGIVRTLKDFGAFVDLGGVDGMIHVSQLSWDRVAHPSDVLSEGQKVKVKIEKIDQDTGRISLSYRDLLENPWTGVAGKYPIGSVVSGAVSKLMNFGAFVRLEAGVEGLIHISELAHQRVASAASVVSEGQPVEVKVLSVDPDAQRISLSLKAANPEPVPDEAASAEMDEQAAPPRPLKSQVPLKGGLERGSDGDRFGLKW